METRVMLIMARERDYEIHKSKVEKAEKRVDNSSPMVFPKILPKSAIDSPDVMVSNLRMYKNLNRIYSRPFKPPSSQVLMRSTPSINRKREASRISCENNKIMKKLISSKPTYSYKEMNKRFKASQEFMLNISRFNRMMSSKKLLRTISKTQEI